MTHEAYYKYWGKVRQQKDGDWDYHLLPYHCLDVAAVGRVLIETSPQLHRIAQLLEVDDRKLLDWFTFIFTIHDIGKFSNGFQSLNPELCTLLRGNAIRANYRDKHWSIGYQWLVKNNADIFPDSNIDLLKYWYSASTGHHGRPPQQTLTPQPITLQFPRDVKADTIYFLKQIKKIFSINEMLFNNEIDYYKMLPRVSWFVAGMTMLSDWIGSNQDWFPFHTEEIPLQIYYENIALKQAKIAVEKTGVLPLPVSPLKGITDLFPILKRFTNLQRTAGSIEIDNCPQLFMLEEETGRGKTEAALILAYRLMSKGLADGIYFALPTMATANAMHKRVEEVYKKFYKESVTPSFILAHSASRMYLSLEQSLSDIENELDEKDNINQDCPFWIADNRKKALLAHIGVGTIDQALLAILQARHQALRLIGLSRKVLIVDEVHACDDYMHTLLRNLLKFHAAQGGSAILLSATLPHAMRKELIESFASGLDLNFNGNLSCSYPLITKCSALGFKEIPIKRDKRFRSVNVLAINREEEALTKLKNIVENGQCACWVRNTVYDAIAAYSMAQNSFGKENVILFHARFALGDRLDIESKILASFGPESDNIDRQGKLVIATQVVEQSLDLDFDFMVSDLAPIDLIIQRAGRLHRHNRSRSGNRINGTDKRDEPVMVVLMPDMLNEPKVDWYKELFPKASKVYRHQGQLWLTAKWLVAHGKFTMPEDAREMIEYVYGEEANNQIPKVFERGNNKAEGGAKAAASMANFNELNLDVGYMPDGVHWIEDSNAPTRLGEPTVLVRLAVWENNKLVPLIRKEQGADWELSQVSVYRTLIAHEDETHRQAIDVAKDLMPDKGKYCLLIPLEKNNDVWIGKALNMQNQGITVYYDNITGLRVGKGEEDEFDS